MKKLKHLTSLLLTLVLISVLFAGCGTVNKDTDTSTAGDTAGDTTEDTAEDTTDEIELIEIVVGATIEPHATILNSEAVRIELEKQGYKINVVEYTDYIQPNAATQDGSLDANFFQHVPYLDDYNSKNGTTLKTVANIHFEPLGIYAGKTLTLETITDGAKIAVPNDTSNEARALILLEKAGIITLKENVGLEATIKDIQDNPKNVEIIEVEAAQTVKMLQDMDFAVVNGNYALAEGLSASEDGLLVEEADSEGAVTYANVIVVKEGNEETDKTKALINAVASEETKKFIEEQWKGAVVPVF